MDLAAVNVCVLVCAWGDRRWRDLAYSRAYPSAVEQGCPAVVHYVGAGNAAATRNEAARCDEALRAEWLCFLDADDELDTDYIASMEQAFARIRRSTIGDVPTESGPRPVRNAELLPPMLLAPALQYVYPSGAETKPELPNRHEPIEVMNHCVIGTLTPRWLFQHVGGFRDWAAYEDWDLTLRCIRAGAQLVDVPAAVYRAHVQVNGRNSQAHGVLRAAYDGIRAEHVAWLYS